MFIVAAETQRLQDAGANLVICQWGFDDEEWTIV